MASRDGGRTTKRALLPAVAFAVEAADLPAYEVRLQRLGVEIRQPRSRVDGEGQSLYFYDFDNHLFELHAGTLEQRLDRYGVAR